MRTEWKSKLTALAVFCVLVLIVSGLAFGQALPRNETLYKAGHQWGPPTNWNPFSPSAAWPTNAEQLLFHRLFAYNLLEGTLDPVIASSLVWVDDLTMEISLRPEARWQDGRAITTDDVAFTLDVAQRNTVAFSPIWDFITGYDVLDEVTLRINMDPEKPHRALVETYLTQITPVPKHIWESVEAAGEIISFTNTEPVGSGPYKLQSYNPEQIVLVRDEDYWGKDVFGVPGPRYVVHPVYKSNDAGNLALQRGEVDYSQQFAPQIWKMWEDLRLPVGTWYPEAPYHIPASIPSMLVNVHKKPLDDPRVRRALAHAINYPLIARTAMSEYSPTAEPSLIVPLGVPEQMYFDEETARAEGWEYNPAKAVDILENELGATKGRDGIYVLPDGTRLGPFYVMCPYGWTDWMTALEIVAQSAQAIGIDIRTEFPEEPVWNDARNTGNFDLLMNTPAGGYTPAHPWLRFRDVMEIRGVPPIGEVAFFNFNRYSNPRVSELLDQAAVASEDELAAIYAELDSIYREDIPIIPLMYRPWEFYEFNETYWKGFPTVDNPTAPPLHSNTGFLIYMQLEPTGR